VPEPFPPIPIWKPSFSLPLDRIVDRLRYYTNSKRDFVVFENGTCAIVSNGLSDQIAASAATEILDKIFRFHPDMQPLSMDDGNIIVQYNHPAINVVIAEIAEANWPEIEARHLDGLTPDEVLITPLGNNVFDDFGKMALLGRSYMFMDALAPKVVRIERQTP
jgi:hypothetical protein